MNNITSEMVFESAIVESLIENGGYTAGNAPDYSPELGMFKYEVIAFLQNTQPKAWEKITAVHGADADNRVIQRLFKELELRGCLDVIRNGFTDYGVKFRMAFFKPETGLNEETIKLYNKNNLKVYRQVYFSSKNKYSIDLVLSLNGLPITTIELKPIIEQYNAG